MVLLIAFALVAAACSSDDSGTEETEETTTTAAAETEESTTTTAAAETTTTTEAKVERPYGGEAVVANDQEPPTLNQFVPGGDNSIVSIVGQTYWAGVQEVSGFTLELIPELVVELPTTSNGGVTVIDYPHGPDQPPAHRSRVTTSSTPTTSSWIRIFR